MVGGYQGQSDNVDQENWNKISHFISTDISRAAAAVQRHNELEPYIYQLEILNFDIDTVMKTQHVQKFKKLPPPEIGTLVRKDLLLLNAWIETFSTRRRL